MATRIETARFGRCARKHKNVDWFYRWVDGNFALVVKRDALEVAKVAEGKRANEAPLVPMEDAGSTAVERERSGISALPARRYPPQNNFPGIALWRNTAVIQPKAAADSTALRHVLSGCLLIRRWRRTGRRRIGRRR
jgi:hypothetical protein